MEMKTLTLILLFLTLTAFTWCEQKQSVTLSWDRSTDETSEEYGKCEFSYNIYLAHDKARPKLVGTTKDSSYVLPVLRDYASGVLLGVSAKAVCGPNEFESAITWSDDELGVSAEKGTFKVRYPASRGVSFGGGTFK